MSLSYDEFTGAFLAKITSHDYLKLHEYNRTQIIDGYMKKAIANFKRICLYDLSTTADDVIREFDIDVLDEDLDELTEIISEGMLAQWMKPYVYRQENLENVLNTSDYSGYSPAELLLRISDAYKSAKSDFKNMMKEYTYNHGDLTDLYL